MARVHTLSSISNPQAQPRTAKERYCPGIKSLFRFNYATWDPRNRERDDQARRLYMLTALVCHTAFDVLGAFLLAISFNILGLLIHTLVSIIGFVFMAGCLAAIGDAEGDRIVMGRVVGRWHFDAFLLFCACVYAAAFLGAFLGLHGISGAVLALIPLPTWIIIFLVAWVTTWETAGVSLA